MSSHLPNHSALNEEPSSSESHFQYLSNQSVLIKMKAFSRESTGVEVVKELSDRAEGKTSQFSFWPLSSTWY